MSDLHPISEAVFPSQVESLEAPKPLPANDFLSLDERLDEASRMAAADFGASQGSYQKFVSKRFKTMGSESASMMHASVGISGEAGELLDAIKKTWVYNKPLDTGNVLEELGDLFFYFTWLSAQLGFSLFDIRRANAVKLLLRYPEGYSDGAAQARADKIGNKLVDNSAEGL